MKSALFILCLTCILSASLFADDFPITSFNSNGRLSWTHSATTGMYHVEWSNFPTGIWQRSWSSLTYLQATSGSRTVDVPMFYRVIWSSNIYDAIYTVSNEELGVMLGVNQTFNGLLGHYPVFPCSVTITVGNWSFVDNGSGILTGTPSGTGSVNYNTGAIAIDLGISLGSDQRVYANYKYRVFYDPVHSHYELVGVGNLTGVVFSAELEFAPIIPATLIIRDDVERFQDNGSGFIFGDKGGYAVIDYQTGKIKVVFWHAPALGQSIMASYWSFR
jgi:hypothetical protein